MQTLTRIAHLDAYHALLIEQHGDTPEAARLLTEAWNDLMRRRGRPGQVVAGV